ncbi:MAG: hypothetical protein U0Q18_21260 [Bryobacteraceae bacterium]
MDFSNPTGSPAIVFRTVSGDLVAIILLAVAPDVTRAITRLRQGYRPVDAAFELA